MSRQILPLLGFLLLSSSVFGQQPFGVRVVFHHTSGSDETSWTGTIQPERCDLVSLEGWRFIADDKIRLNTFEMKAWELFDRGILLSGTTSPGGKIHVTTNHGKFSFELAPLRLGDRKSFLSGSASVERLPDVEKLTDDFRDDDYPSIAVAEDGTAWAVWQSYSGQMDEVRISMYDGVWHTFSRVPGVSGDVWRPQVALDSEAKPWVVWSQQVDGNFDLYTRAFDPEAKAWEKMIRLSSDPLPDFDHHLIADGKGHLWVVWQGFRKTNADILLRHYDGSEWSREIRVTDHMANDWEPRVAVGRDGRASIVWDTYRNGNYDVYLRGYHPESGLGDEVPVAVTPRFEAHPSVAVDGSGRVWVAWDEGGTNWGKDWGPTLDPEWRTHAGPERESFSRGTRLYDARNLNLVVLESNGRRLSVESPLAPVAEQDRDTFDFGQLMIDPKTDRVGVLFHHGVWSKGVPRRRPRERIYWETALTFYDGDRWQPQWTMPYSASRGSARPAAAYGPDSSLWVIWPNDGRSFPDVLRATSYQRNPQKPTVNNIYAARLPLDPSPKPPVLKPAVQTEAVVRPAHSPVHPNEEQDLRTIRSYRTFIHGTETRIVRGDLHRHTELSFDSEGRRDGSLFDFYRYMLDAASMDFGAVTDHNSGGDLEYWWWLIEKSSDLYHVPRTYTTFYGYERSLGFPNGHRNILHTRRGVPVVSFFTEPALTGPRPGIAVWGSEPLENDTKLLYESLRRTGGMAISHTTGSVMGTDWRDSDPVLEPVVEIFQGDRVSYEHVGAPRAARSAADNPPGAFEEAGFLWNAYRKGLRLGTIASSDHWSTHISYALVYTNDPTREAIFDAIQKRRTYGATDNIILDYRIGEHFMGEEFSTSELEPLEIKVIGTDKIARIEIIKDEKVIYTATPGKQEVTLRYVDQDVAPGTSYYYARVIQSDREIAWASPIWVTFKPSE